MDSLTISPSTFRRNTLPDDMLLGESMFEWEAPSHSYFPLQQQQQLSPPEMDFHTPLVSNKHNSTSATRLQKTPIRQRASSSASLGHYDMFGNSSSDDNNNNKGLVTPISMTGTPATFWAGQKLEFMTPTPRDEYSTLNTPLATPVPLMPTSPLYDNKSSPSGTNPFYCLPLCMRASSSSSAEPLPSPDLDHLENNAASAKAKAMSAAEEALASFSEPSPEESGRERTLSEGGSGDGRPDKPFGCSHCPKSFRRMEHLRRHVKIHTKERPYSCDIAGCDRKFSRSDNLKAHMKTHAKRTGRNIYVEGLEIDEVQATPKRRKVD